MTEEVKKFGPSSYLTRSVSPSNNSLFSKVQTLHMLMYLEKFDANL